MQSHSRESCYFVLPARKSRTVILPRSASMKWALALVLMIVTAMVALSLGLWWDSITPLATRSFAAPVTRHR
jgi:hypothetical protein